MLSVVKFEKRAKKYCDILARDEKILALVLDAKITCDIDINNKDIVVWVISDYYKNKVLVVKDGKLNIKFHYVTKKQFLNFKEDVLEQIVRNGKIVFDRNEKITKLFKSFIELKNESISKLVFMEFVKFIKNYNKSCEMLVENKIFDSFNYIIKAMNNWAKVLIIENSVFLCDDIWETVKTINIGIYKLYEELVGSSESIQDKVKLMQLIFDNAISKQAVMYCKILFEAMKTKESMTLEEIGSKLNIDDFEFQESFEYLLQELTKRKIVKKYYNESLLDGLDNEEKFTQVLYGLKKKI